MQVQCHCGAWAADVARFPAQTPGRVGCYCDDCQSYLIHLGRTDLLDAAGMSEVVPVYPCNIIIARGKEHMRCLRLGPKGLYRWYAACCTSPIGNFVPGMPWMGLFAHTFAHLGPRYLEDTLGPVKSRIMGKYAKAPTPPGTAATFNLRAFFTVGPFIVRGKLGRKHLPSPYLQASGAPLVEPTVLTADERIALRARFEQQGAYA